MTKLREKIKNTHFLKTLSLYIPVPLMLSETFLFLTFFTTTVSGGLWLVIFQRILQLELVRNSESQESIISNSDDGCWFGVLVSVVAIITS